MPLIRIFKFNIYSPLSKLNQENSENLAFPQDMLEKTKLSDQYINQKMSNISIKCSKINEQVKKYYDVI